MKYSISTPDPSEEKLFYSCGDDGIRNARIGQLQMDFGSGMEFHSRWFENNPEMCDSTFKQSFGELFNSMRNNLLSSRGLMSAMLKTMTSLDLGDNVKGVKVETDDNVFYLRCSPQSGSCDCCCYCYDRGLLEQAMSEEIVEEPAMQMGGMM